MKARVFDKNFDAGKGVLKFLDLSRARRAGVVASLIAVGLLLATEGMAKRAGPPSVSPVVHEGVRYVAPNDDGRRGYVQAFDAASGKKLWEATVFRNPIQPRIEEDVQWVFIKSLRIREGRLIVTDEKDRQYPVRLILRTADDIPKDNPAGHDVKAGR